VAHRGGAGLGPENTLVAFERSYALGIRYLETDVRLSADGVAVLLHDDRTALADGRRRSIRDTARADLPPGVAGLEQALTRLPDAAFSIDIKDVAAVEAIVAILHRTGAARRVCVAGTWDHTLAQLAAEAGPELSTAMGWRALVQLVTSARSRLPLIRRGLPLFAHVPLRVGRMPVFSDCLLARAHDIGVRVLVWTVDDPPTMHRLLDAGVDGIITDRPDLLREVLIARDQWNPIGSGARPQDGAGALTRQGVGPAPATPMTEVS
jgi:glycerophosphoryl diester phosphodiesterase